MMTNAERYAQMQKVGAAFLRTHRWSWMPEVKMSQGAIEKRWHCGTIACHGGWWAVANKIKTNDYADGAKHMAQTLGFEDVTALKVWAHRNPQIWGNYHGGDMFQSRLAFGVEPYEEITLKDIGNHWLGVAERYKQAHLNKYGELGKGSAK